MEEHLSRKIIEEISRAGRFDEEPGSGIALKIDVEDAIGVLHQAQEITQTIEEELWVRKKPFAFAT